MFFSNKKKRAQYKSTAHAFLFNIGKNNYILFAIKFNPTLIIADIIAAIVVLFK